MFLTITLNPALDKIIYIDRFEAGKVIPLTIRQTLAGGRGVGVAKVLRDLGHPVTVGGLIGSNHSAVFERLCITRSINDAFTRIGGQTRTNIHIKDADGNETELLEPAPPITPKEWESFTERLGQILEGCDMIAVSGSVPPSITPQMFSDMLTQINRYHLPVLIDTEDVMLDVACAKHPKLLKFNREKILRQLGRTDFTEEQLFAYAEGLIKMGVENVLISLDKDGAYLFCKQGAYKTQAPKVDIVSTLGCGDAMVASVAESLTQGRSPEEMLKHAMAISSANCLTLETSKVNLEDYKRILDTVTVEKIK